MEITGASNITSCYIYVWVMKGGKKSKSQIPIGTREDLRD